MNPSDRNDIQNNIQNDIDDGTIDRSIWDALEKAPMETPPDSLRSGFYRRLRRGEGEPWWRPRWLVDNPWVPALATLVLGLAIGLFLPRENQQDDQTQVLTARLATLNRTVAMALLANDSASERLRGVRFASEAISTDPQMADVLLAAAGDDPVASVRSAAIEALGPRMIDESVSSEIIRMLVDTDSVLVQMALADLILRWGSDDHILFLIEQADEHHLHEDVSRFVMDHVREVSA